MILHQCLISNFVDLFVPKRYLALTCMPLLSVIIPSFNSLNSLKECIESIKSQNFKDYEVFVIDSQSTDGTKEYLNTLTPPFFSISEPDQGIYDAMNKGIRLAKGQWLYFLGCDDRIHNHDTLKNLFNEIVTDDISLIIGKVQYDFGLHDSYMIKKNKGLFEPSWSKKIWLKNTLHHQGVFYNRKIFRSQKYSLTYKVLSDYELNLKLFRMDVKVKMIDLIIAISKTEGISKNYNWQLYKEEVDFKTKQSSIIFMPIFYLLAIGKYLFKQAI